MRLRNPRIAVIGGGTGSFAMLSGLKAHTRRLTALVNMVDDGGSSGVLRDELGVLPPGDVRQCLVALSTAADELRELFNFRFPEGSFQGHSFGNLFLSAVERMTNNFDDAVRLASDVLRIRGEVLPITSANCRLVMRQGKTKIVGQNNIAHATISPSSEVDLSLEPQASITVAAQSAILDADLVVIAPGDLYTSLAPALLVDGVGQALAATNAKVAFVCSLVNKPDHTFNFSVQGYAAEIERFAGQEVLDYVLYNTDEPEPELLQKYASAREYPVRGNSQAMTATHYRMIGGAFLSRSEPRRRDPNDILLERSFIRHDGAATAKALLKLV